MRETIRARWSIGPLAGPPRRSRSGRPREEGKTPPPPSPVDRRRQEQARSFVIARRVLMDVPKLPPG